ncbi:MAG: pilus assembly protein PilM [bacterium]
MSILESTLSHLGTTILSLDIGHSTLKLAEIKRNPTNKFQLKKIVKKKLLARFDSFNREEKINVIKELIDHRENIEPDLIISSLSSEKANFRQLSIPFKDKNKIKKIIKYEVESYLPLNVDEIVIDYWITDESSEEKTDLIIAAVRKSDIEERIDILREAGIEPAYIYLDAVALSNSYDLLDIINKNQSTNAIIDVGAKKTLVIIISNNRLELVRAIPLAGDFITNRIVKDLQVNFEKAEYKKEKVNYDIIKDFSTDRLSACIFFSLNQLFKEIERTFFSYLANKKDTHIENIFITGGTTCLKGFNTSFQNYFNITVEPFSLDNYLENVLFQEPISEWLPFIPVVLGLAYPKNNDQAKQKNLRQEELSYRFPYKKYKNELVAASILFFSFLILISLNLHLRLFLTKKQVRHYDSEIQDIIKTNFPSIGKILPGKQVISQVKNAIKKNAELNKKFNTLIKKKNPTIQVLYDILSIIPENKIMLTQMDIRSDIIYLSGEAISFDAFNELKSKLKTIDYVEKVDGDGVNGNNKVQYNLSLSMDRK